MTSEKVLEITGHAGVPVPNLFFKQSTSSNRLALLLPGARYTVDMPVLYYTSLILQAHGIDVLEVKYDYDRPAFLSAAPDERLAWIYDDIYASWQAGLAAGKYQHFILTGKSIGTLGMALLLNRHRELSSSTTIWLTPLLHHPEVIKAALGLTGKSFFLAGTDDQTFDPVALESIQKQTHARAWIAEKGNHSLEIEGNPLRSLELLTGGVYALSDFLE